MAELAGRNSTPLETRNAGPVRETAELRHNQKGSLPAGSPNLLKTWLRGVDLNHRPLGYEGN
jgi:hypothetical protein